MHGPPDETSTSKRVGGGSDPIPSSMPASTIRS